MMMTPRKMLGLAVADGAISAVEVGLVRGSRRVLHAAEFPLPQGDAPQDPAQLGKALRQFLRQNHFTASRCVIGLGGRWLVAKEKSLPPTAPDLLAGVLSIATEREFSSDAKDLTFDYSGPIRSAQGESVFLVAAPHRQVDHLVATAQAAGLTAKAVTSSTMALASATGDPAAARLAGAAPALGRRLVLSVSRTAAELSVQSGGSFQLIRRLPLAEPPAGRSPAAGEGVAAATWLDDLAGELHRIVALLPGTQAQQQGPELLIWCASGLPADALSALGPPATGREARLCKYPSDLGIADGVAGAGGEFAAATALAVAGLTRPLLAVDFLHSRLNPRKKLALRKKVAWGAAVAAAITLAGLLLFLDWQKEEQEVQDLKDQLDGMKDSLASAKDTVDKVAFARGWYDRRPRHLECLRQITLAFPAEGRIWATSVAINEDRRVLLSGKAADEKAVLEVMDRLSANRRFLEVKPMYIREVGGGSSEVSFAISLNFAGAN